MTPKRPRDPNLLAKRIIDIATGDDIDSRCGGNAPTPSEEKTRTVSGFRF